MTIKHKWELVIAALLDSPTIEAAAAKSGVGRSTILKWLKDSPEFRAAYQEARRAVVDQTIARLQQTSAEAGEALRRNLTCGVPASEIAAAKLVLEQSLRGIDNSELEAKVRRLEQMLIQLQPKPQGDNSDERSE